MVSPTSLKYCLHQISRMAGITVAIGKAVRSAALLVEEMEEYAIAETIRKTVNTQLTAITEDLQILTSDVREKIDQKMEESSKELDKYTDNVGRLITKLESTAHVVSQPNTTNNTTLACDGTRTYAQATVSPPAHANPKLAAREGIRARQFMLEGVDRESKIGGMNNSQLKLEFERILRETGIEGKGLRMVTKQRLSGILIETDNDKIAAWLRKESTAEEFCEKIGPGAKFKTRTYDLIAYNVPLTLEPTNPNHLTEINEVNQLDPGVIKSARWVKPIARRSPSQRSAHLILSFTDVNAANRALTGGLTICHSRTRIGKIKKEPIRCLKCQNWNHYANECKASEDTCSNCAKPHRTSKCPNPLKRRCVSCKTSDHASWSRECPTFVRKTDECNARYPENDDAQHTSLTSENGYLARSNYVYPASTFVTHYASS